MAKRREDFEKWRKAILPKSNLNRTGNIYHSDDVNYDWQSWNAALDSLAVELPEAIMMQGEAVYHAPEIESMLEKAGIKYK